MSTQLDQGKFSLNEAAWDAPSDRAYECRVLICPDEEGGFTAHAIRLPGVVSEGETVNEALENIADAFQAAIQTYLETGSIPWEDAKIERSKGAFERWIIVNA